MKRDDRLEILVAQRKLARLKLEIMKDLNNRLRTSESLMLSEGAYAELEVIEATVVIISGGGME